MRLALRSRARRLALVSLVALPALAAPTLATAASTTVQGETLTTVPSYDSAVQTYPSNANVAGAVGNSALAIWSANTVSISTSLAVTSVKVRAKATGPGAPAVYNVKLDGTTIGSGISVAAGGWVDYTTTLPAAAPASSHTVTIEFTGTPSGGAQRNFYIDQITVDDTRSKLTWAPPTLTNPVTINVPTSGDHDDTASPARWTTPYSYAGYKLQNDKDYVINLPSSTRSGLRIDGGRNVVIVGGSLASTGNVALWMSSQVGTVHIEGVLVDNSSHLAYSDGLFLQGPSATYQVQNTRVIGIRGTTNASEHGDALRVPAATAIKVDRFTATSSYQGVFIRPDTGPISSIDIRNADISIFDDTMPGAVNAGGDALFFLNPSGARNAANNYQWAADSVAFSNTYVQSVRSSPSIVYPWTTEPAPYAATLSGTASSGTITYPTFPGLTGSITRGAPLYSYVKSGEAGLGYTTPGYN